MKEKFLKYYWQPLIKQIVIKPQNIYCGSGNLEGYSNTTWDGTDIWEEQ